MVGRVDIRDRAEDQTLTLSHGRRLGYAQYGRAGAEPIFVSGPRRYPGDALAEPGWLPPWLPVAGPNTLVPPAMGRYLAEQIPNCHARLLPGEGHLLIIDRVTDLVQVFR